MIDLELVKREALAMVMWSEFRLFAAAVAWADRARRLGYRAELRSPGHRDRPRGASSETWVVEVVVDVPRSVADEAPKQREVQEVHE